MNNKVIYCGNCGKKGHVYKNCYKPIISLGILCVKYDDLNLDEIIKKNKKNNKIFNKYTIGTLLSDTVIKNIVDKKLKFLMVCRKHTLAYIEFIRGNYGLENYRDVRYLKNMVSLMTQHEINNIEKKDFNLLWNDLWILPELSSSHKKEYETSNLKFQQLVNGFTTVQNDFINLEYFIESIGNIKWIEPEWEFPKGRRNIKEKDLPCAIREFLEETNYNENDYQLLDFNPMSEIFMGNNGINYKHTFYLAQINTPQNPIIDPSNIFQNIEVSDIKWLTFDEAIKKIRPYNNERKELLKKVYNLIYYNLYQYYINH